MTVLCLCVIKRFTYRVGPKTCRKKKKNILNQSQNQHKITFNNNSESIYLDNFSMWCVCVSFIIWPFNNPSHNKLWELFQPSFLTFILFVSSVQKHVRICVTVSHECNIFTCNLMTKHGQSLNKKDEDVGSKSKQRAEPVVLFFVHIYVYYVQKLL